MKRRDRTPANPAITIQLRLHPVKIFPASRYSPPFKREENTTLLRWAEVCARSFIAFLFLKKREDRGVNHIWFYLTSAILSFCVIVATVRVGNWSVKSLAGPLPPVPPLNVYLDLVFSGKRFAELKEISNLESNEVVQIVEKFRPDLLRARTLADDPAMVALDTKRGWAEAHEEDQKALKRLAVVLILDGKAALNDHRPMDAVASALAAVKVGHSAIRGGTRVDGLTGLIIQAIAVADIQAMIPKLDPAELRMIIKTLQELDGQDESAEQILARDHLWERKTYGVWWGI